MIAWYAVRTHPRGEDKALMNLVAQGYKVYLPRFLKARRHARKADTIATPLFPRYLFVQLNDQSDAWRPINSTFGVSHIVSICGRPAPVPRGVIEALYARENGNGYVDLDPLDGLRRGDKVEVLSGPMAELIGEFHGMTSDQRVTVLLNLLGRPVRVSLPTEAVTAHA